MAYEGAAAGAAAAAWRAVVVATDWFDDGALRPLPFLPPVHVGDLTNTLLTALFLRSHVRYPVHWLRLFVVTLLMTMGACALPAIRGLPGALGTLCVGPLPPLPAALSTPSPGRRQHADGAAHGPAATVARLALKLRRRRCGLPVSRVRARVCAEQRGTPD
jgi:hypothetical protein